MSQRATPRTCANDECGRTFWDHRTNTRYCSSECRRQFSWRKFTNRLSGYDRPSAFSRKGKMPRPTTASRSNSNSST